MNKNNLQQTIERYNQRLAKFGYSEEALGWSKNKNNYRFEALITEWKSELTNSSVCDFGCGFGDLYQYLTTNHCTPKSYTGIDINENLINIGKEKYPDAKFWCGNILTDTFNDKFDFTFSSGVFNHKLSGEDEFEFIKNCMVSINSFTTKGFAINFLSDKVDFFTEHNYNANPGRIIELCYSFSNNIVLRNDYMPYEFTVYVRKDILVNKEKVVYQYE